MARGAMGLLWTQLAAWRLALIPVERSVWSGGRWELLAHL